jgi:hypothetical protein
MAIEIFSETKKPFPIIDSSTYGVHENHFVQHEMIKLFLERESLLRDLYDSDLITFNEINFFRNYSKSSRKTPPALNFFTSQIDILKQLQIKRRIGSSVKSERNFKPKINKFEFFTNPKSIKSIISPESFSLLSSLTEVLNKEHQNFINNSLKSIPNIPNIVFKTYQNSELDKGNPNFDQELPKMNSIKVNISRLLETYISTEINSDLNNLENLLKMFYKKCFGL